jgi:hypothetical protein
MTRWLVTVAFSARAAALSGGDLCAQCHRQIYETYREPTMAHSLYQPRPENTIEDWRWIDRWRSIRPFPKRISC